MASRQLRVAIGALALSISCAALAENALTTDTASVRAGPDDSYPEVAVLDADSPIQVMGCLDDWSWCDVTFDGNRGWLYSPDITYEYEGGYVPFYTYAPAFSVPVVTFTVDAYWGRYYHDRPWFRERDQWAHRVVEHRPPPGPPPHRGPPPREVVSRDRPHGGPPGDHSIRLGSAAPRPPEHAPPSAHERPPAPNEPSRDERRNGHDAPDNAADDRRDGHRAPDHAAADHRDEHRAIDPASVDRRDEHPGPDPAAFDHRRDDHHGPDAAAADHRSDDHRGPGSGTPEHALPEHPTPPHSAPPPHAAPERAAPQHEAHEKARPEPPRSERHEEPPRP